MTTAPYYRPYLSLDNLNLSEDSTKVLKAIIMFFEKLKTIQNTYLFGSSTWRLINNEFDPSKSDIDLLMPMNYSSRIIIMLKNILDYFNIPYIIDQKHLGKMDIYPNAKMTCYTILSFKITINDELNMDMIFCDKPKLFIQNMSDIDIGMLVYNISLDKLLVGGDYSSLTVDSIINNAQLKRLSTTYMSENINNIQTTIARIMKMIIHHGFTFYSCSSRRILFYIIRDSLHTDSPVLSNIEKINCRRKKYKCCTCIKSTEFKINQVLSIHSYEFVKQILNELIVLRGHTNYCIDVMIHYALLMKDYEYAIYLLDFFRTKKGDRINLNYIITLLRKINQISITTRFITKICENGMKDFIVCFTCELPAVKILEAFIIDATYGNDISYYFKLVHENPILNFNLSLIRHDIYYPIIFNFTRKTVNILLKRRCKYLSTALIYTINEYLGI